MRGRRVVSHTRGNGTAWVKASVWMAAVALVLVAGGAHGAGSRPWVKESHSPRVHNQLMWHVFTAGNIESQAQHASNQYSVRLPLDVNPDVVAADLGLYNHGQIGILKGHYLFELPLKSSGTTLMSMEGEGAEGTVAYHTQMAGVDEEEEVASAAALLQPESEAVYTQMEARVAVHPAVEWSQREVYRRHSLRAVPTTEPATQWHIKNTGGGGGTAGADCRVEPVWAAGTMGASVQVCIVDDGMQINNPELAPGYQSADSYDFNGNDNNPSPGTSDNHGTACAGCAVARDDGTCGLGTAFRARVSALRLIAGGVTDATEANALSYRLANNDIFSNSWGPTDDGRTVAGPGTLTQQAMETATTTGRNNRGTIYVWAGGNGGENNDNGNLDGYGNNVFTLSVGGFDNNDDQASISEPCSCLHVVAPTQGTVGTLGITTTDRTGTAGYSNNACTPSFGGTSAACPLAAGVIALVLDKYPTLTWRQVKHLMVYHSRQLQSGDASWVTNGAGVKHSDKFGFGAVDAETYVAAAANYTTTMPAMVLKAGTLVVVNQNIPDNNAAGVTSTYTVAGVDSVYVEHVQVEFTASHNTRGNLRVELTSPSGTVSVLAEQRPDNNNNYNGWKFVTVKCWGEQSAGTWTLRVADRTAGATGTFDSWKLNVYGTVTQYGRQSGGGGGATPTSTPTPTPTASPNTGGDSSTSGGGNPLLGGGEGSGTPLTDAETAGLVVALLAVFAAIGGAWFFFGKRKDGTRRVNFGGRGRRRGNNSQNSRVAMGRTGGGGGGGNEQVSRLINQYGGGGAGTGLQPPAAAPPAPPSGGARPSATALYDYQARDGRELNIRTGDVMQVKSRGNDGWSLVVNQQGQQGYVPTNYIQ